MDLGLLEIETALKVAAIVVAIPVTFIKCFLWVRGEWISWRKEYAEIAAQQTEVINRLNNSIVRLDTTLELHANILPKQEERLIELEKLTFAHEHRLNRLENK